jgi:hypothetical protein
MLCIRFVKALGHSDDRCGGQAFHLLLYKMRADRNVGKKQAVNFLLDNPWFAASFFLREIAKA